MNGWTDFKKTNLDKIKKTVTDHLLSFARKTYESRRKYWKILDLSKLSLVFAMFSCYCLIVFNHIFGQHFDNICSQIFLHYLKTIDPNSRDYES